MKYVVIGVDPAKTRLHGVVWDGHRYKLVKRTMPGDIVLCTVKAYTWIQRIIKETRARYLRDVTVVVAVEEPVLGSPNRRGANATIPNAKVHGAILAGAYRAGAVVIPVNNQRWKKEIVGKGNCSKEYVAAHVKRTWPVLYREAGGVQDWLDASCIALYGMYVMNFREKMAAKRLRKEES